MLDHSIQLYTPIYYGAFKNIPKDLVIHIIDFLRNTFQAKKRRLELLKVVRIVNKAWKELIDSKFLQLSFKIKAEADVDLLTNG